jgi:hypothetical protein
MTIGTAVNTSMRFTWRSQFRYTANSTISQREDLEKTILAKVQPLLRGSPGEHVNNVFVTPQMPGEAGWQEKAKAWVAGEGVTNQGWVRSDNIARGTFDRLLFRSQPEIELY